jgi:D-alanyl-lipoteichoic acid acyltransferase DltB (MBOAT superfamily)
MLFHSNEFLLFLGAFLLFYWRVRGNLHARNVLVVAASYLFYGWWDWRFLGLLLFSSGVDFWVGLAMARSPDGPPRRRWLKLSLATNLGVLGFFKYFNFFLESFHGVLRAAGVEHPSWTWNIILPVGISFYTFQTLSYTLDVYYRRIEPTRDLIAFLAFVSFFPQLVAGPIERASHLLPQFQTPRLITPDDLKEGVWLILWGLFKKVVVADNLARHAELAFDHSIVSGPVVLLGTLAFAGQIYGDFSGYSDIARGLGRVLGFDLRLNFNLPYVASNVREFWRRWHISLSTWLRDYLYVPLGGNRRGESRTRINLLLTMILGGLWHGASWNFAFWGAWHGVALVIHRAWSERVRLPAAMGWVLTLTVVGYGWLLFRAGSMTNVARLHHALIHWSAPPWITDFTLGIAAWWLPLALVQFWQWHSRDLLAPLRCPRWILLFIEGALVMAIASYWQREAAPFIYFQF